MTPNRHGSAVIEFPSELEIVTTREFDAPMELVFDVLTKPEHVRNWFAPFTDVVTECSIDLRVGGSYHIVFVTEDGAECSFRGTYLEVEPPTRTVATWLFEGWPDADAVESVDLHETDGVTKLTMKLAFRDQAGRDHMTKSDGQEDSFNKMEDYLRSLLDPKGNSLQVVEARSTIGRVDEFVPRDFDVPRRLETPQFVLEPLGPEHSDQDYDAWTSSEEHIHATPGWEDSSWPREMTPDENRADLQRHADDFRNRTGFTYTVLDPASRDVIGCVYIYPRPDSDYDARALSWVRASHAQLDTSLWRAVSKWLASDWPFGSVEYAPRA